MFAWREERETQGGSEVERLAVLRGGTSVVCEVGVAKVDRVGR